jgi:prolyl 4-hydroxylase
MELETLSISPKVFYVRNFMSSEEADALVARATDKSNPYSMRPSTVGHQSWTQGDGASSSASTRTSENAFDIDSPTARRLKDRAWKLLKLAGPYDETMADGFQVLRYQPRQAYIAHMDSFPIGASSDHNWDPSKGGTNRFATLFVYLSDVDAGGQTVFPKADPLGETEPVPEEAKQLFPKKGWETEMLDQCYSRLSVKPKKGNAILFYSQKDGKLDPMALHGGCPVLKGTKWAANLWFWNQCRFSMCEERHKSAGVEMSPQFFKTR